MEQLKLYVGGIVNLKVRDGQEGSPLLYRVGQEIRTTLSDKEAEELIGQFMQEPMSLWRTLKAPDTLRPRFMEALRRYRTLAK